MPSHNNNASICRGVKDGGLHGEKMKASGNLALNREKKDEFDLFAGTSVAIAVVGGGRCRRMGHRGKGSRW